MWFYCPERYCFNRNCKSPRRSSLSRFGPFTNHWHLSFTLLPFWLRMVAVFSAISLLCFFFLTSLLQSMPQCVKDCNREFKNEAALSRHRKTCSVLEIVRQRSHEIRRGRGRSVQPNISTVHSRKERLQVGNQSYSGICTSYIFDLGTSCACWQSEFDGLDSYTSGQSSGLGDV
jgi:hypothetical protein